MTISEPTSGVQGCRALIGSTVELGIESVLPKKWNRQGKSGCFHPQSGGGGLKPRQVVITDVFYRPLFHTPLPYPPSQPYSVNFPELCTVTSSSHTWSKYAQLMSHLARPHPLLVLLRLML